MEESTTKSVLTTEQRQCLVQIFNEIAYTLVFTGQDTELFQILKKARSISKSDHATVNSAQNNLARTFAGTSVTKIGELKLSYFIAGISAALQKTSANDQQNITTGPSTVDHGWNTDLSAGTDGSQANHASPSILLPKSGQPVQLCDDIDSEGDTVMIQHGKPLCQLCTCEACKKRQDRAKKKEMGKKPNSLYNIAKAFPREDLFDILDKYWLTLQVHGLYPDQSCERFQWSVDINGPASVQRRQYHLILRHLRKEDELHPWRRFVAEYKTLEGYNEFHREATRQKIGDMQARESGENDNNRALKEYVRQICLDNSPRSFSEAKKDLKNDLRFARRWVILVDGFTDEKDGGNIPGLGVGVGLVYGPGIKKMMCVEI